MNQLAGVLLSIDTASDIAGVAFHRDGVLLAETTWYSYQAHSRDLLPVIDWQLNRLGLDKAEIGAVAVCLGPGSYAGLRVGLSTAKTLAYALGVPIVGVGRLAADALEPCLTSGSRTMALQAAGRAELAWATYEPSNGSLVETKGPGLASREAILAALRPGDLVVGDDAVFTGGFDLEIEARQARVARPPAARALSISRLAIERLARGEVDNADSLVPLYLRAPAIGPQTH